MKKSKVVIASLLAVSALVAGFTAVGCKKHKHKYSKEYTAISETEHWQAATCEHTDLGRNVKPHDFNDSYYCATCNYQLEIAGIGIEKTVTEYKLNGTTTTAINTNDITVSLYSKGDRAIKTIDEWSIDIYNGKETVADISNVKAGAYNIWAKSTHPLAEGKESFVVVYVLDELTKIELKADEGTFTQRAGAETMSSTWKFVATYASGAQKELTKEDVKITGLDVTKVTSEGKATVTYSDVNAKGETTEKSCEVSYTVTEGKGKFTYTYDFEALKAAVEANGDDPTAATIALSQKHFTTPNDFITLEEDLDGTGKNIARVDYRGGNNLVLEYKNAALGLTFGGKGSVTIKPRSTSGSNKSTIALIAPDGSYVAAEYDTSNTNIQKDDTKNAYVVTGNRNANEMTFKITAPGKYKLTTIDSATVGGEPVATGRGARLDALTMTDIIGDEGETTDEYEYKFSVLKEAMGAKADEATAAVAQENLTGDNAFLTVVAGGTVNYRGVNASDPTKRNDVLEFKGEALSVTFQGTGTLEISVRSTGNSNKSTFALKDAEGNYIEATTATPDTNVKKDDSVNAYLVTGKTGENTLTFTITKAGTYTLCTLASATVGGTPEATDRAARLEGLKMTDIH